MGYDMIATWAFSPKDQPLSWQTAVELVPSLTDDELNAFAEQASGDGLISEDDETGLFGLPADEIREQITGEINDLSTDERELLAINAPGGWTVYLAGGMSGGDDPCHAFTCLSNLTSVPRLMAAAGFLVPITARFNPQAWVRDQAMDVDPQGEQEWDAGEEFARMPADYRLRLLSDMASDMTNEALDNDDWLKGDPNAPEWVREYHGPFSIWVRIGGRD